MTRTSATERRNAFRALLEREQVTQPASVWDAPSARIVDDIGFDLGMFAGSIASHTILGAPDMVLLTLTEFVEQARRITRIFETPLMVDADHGYGNALNVMRTIEELEAAGVAALTIEDTLLPRAYGQAGAQYISRDELRGKLRAALEARTDASLAVIGRSGVYPSMGLDETLARLKIGADAGVDGFFVQNVSTKEDLQALSAATPLPLVINTAIAPVEELASMRVRVMIQGHLPYFVAMRALHEAYLHLKGGGTPAGLRESAATAALQAIALAEAEYDRLAKGHLGA